ncbi:hypothetical protein EG327_003828 [Venturia inaequalis]|uniref:Uncharacterized protein n=1 Tax=Venturia inaequalis TaxID=5025 RepID=A0A8H3VGT0_VENIN|nr:hypothetical protein EG327_003828 [Venturia inaequalis]
MANSSAPDNPAPAPSPAVQRREYEERLAGVDEHVLDERAAEAARKDGGTRVGEGYSVGRRENYGGDGEGSAERGDGDEGEDEGEDGGEDEEGGGEGEEDGDEEGSAGGEGEDGEVDGDGDGDVEMSEDEAIEDREIPRFSGVFLLHRGPIRPILSPISEASEDGSSNNGDDDDENEDEDADMNDVSSDAIASSSEEEEEDNDPTPSFALQTAPSTRRPLPPIEGQGKAAIHFGALGRAIEPEPPSPALSEAETIILPSRRPQLLNTADSRPASPSPTPTTGLFPPSSATTSTPTTARTPNFLQAWRYKDVVLPDELPKTMAQWARLEFKVRTVTPLPEVKGSGVMGDDFVEGIKERYGELMVKEQKRVLEVVKKSKVNGSYDDDWEFLTGVDKKSQQVNWDGLSSQALVNMRAMIEVIEFEDFEEEMAEANEYANPPHSTSPSTFKVVKRSDNYWGIGWSFRDSTGKFEGLTEDEMEAYHRELYPKRNPVDPKLVLGVMGEDGRRAGEEVYEGPARMQLKDEIKGSKRVLERKPGLLRGGEPGTWPFWVADEDKHLRDWVLTAQGEA